MIKLNGNDIIEYIESKQGTVEDAFIEEHKDEFMRFAEQEMLNEINGV